MQSRRTADAITRTSVVALRYHDGISHEVLCPDDAAVREIETALQIAEASGEITSVGNLKMTLTRADALGSHTRATTTSPTGNSGSGTAHWRHRWGSRGS